MVRRGGRTAVAPTSTSSSSSHKWNRSRPHSVNGGDAKELKSSDSTRSSPIGSSQSTSGNSPLNGKKHSDSGRGGRSSSHWRSRGGASGRYTDDSKFTSEDFPVLPGARGTTSTPNKYMKQGRYNGHGDVLATDDSGVSSGSRGHTPVQDSVSAAVIMQKNDRLDHKKKTSEQNKRKMSSPTKERAPRGIPKSKSINTANTANTTPSFMKLSKLGQKIPERRGGIRVNHASVSPPTNDGKNKENEAKIATDHKIIPEFASGFKLEQGKPVEPINPDNVPKIILGADGEMSNIPSSMLTDQFGMAAMLPILDIIKNRNFNQDTGDLSEEKMKERLLHANIEMTCIGIDLNELGVPIKTSDNKTVWQSFAGPFGNQPLPPTNMGLSYYQVPSVYYTARTLKTSFDMTQNIPDKFGVHELFYIFYNLPKELWQLNAARELQNRGWRFNIKEKLWVHKKLGEPDEFGITVTAPQNPFTLPGTGQDDVMIGIFEIYDAEKARITSREMCLRRSDFEVPAWEQTVPDAYQKMVASVLPKDVLWGPRDDRINKSGLLPGMAGIVSSGAGRAVGNKLSNLVIPKQQSSARRLLSFAESPDLTPNFDSPFGSLPPATTTEDLYRQQMYAVILQKMQQQQLQQQQQHQQASTSSSFNHFH